MFGMADSLKTTDWQPIGTVPEGDYVLLNHPGWYPCVTLGFVSDGQAWGICTAGYPASKYLREDLHLRRLDATLWRRLPANPWPCAEATA